MTDAQPSGRGTAQPAWVDRFRGAMLGGAVGDAVGSGVRALPLAGIRSCFGPAGIRGYAPVFGRRGAAGDVSQLAVFTLDGLLRAKAANPGGDSWLPTDYLGANYLRWLHTQGVPWEYAMSAHLAREPRPAGWLLDRAELNSTRNPGGPALAMIGKMAERFPIGPDGLLRPHSSVDGLAACAAWAAPAMVWSPNPDVVHATAAATANLFTSGANALSAAGLHSDVLAQLLRGARLWDAVTAADLNRLGSAYRVNRVPAGVRRTVHAAMFLGQRGLPVRPEDLDVEFDVEDEPGELGIALAAVSSTRTFADAVLAAVNHSGDSSVTGALAGQLAGAIHGPASIPREWLDELELREAVEILCQDAAEAFAPQRPRWAERYMPNAEGSSLPELPSAPGRTVEGSAETTMVLPAIGARRPAPERPGPSADAEEPVHAAPSVVEEPASEAEEPFPTGPIPVVAAETAPETTAVFPAVADDVPGEPAADPAVAEPPAAQERSGRERARHQPATSWLGSADKPAPSWLSAPGKPAFAAFIEQTARQQEIRERSTGAVPTDAPADPSTDPSGETGPPATGELAAADAEQPGPAEFEANSRPAPRGPAISDAFDLDAAELELADGSRSGGDEAAAVVPPANDERFEPADEIWPHRATADDAGPTSAEQPGSDGVGTEPEPSAELAPDGVVRGGAVFDGSAFGAAVPGYADPVPDGGSFAAAEPGAGEDEDVPELVDLEPTDSPGAAESPGAADPPEPVGPPQFADLPDTADAPGPEELPVPGGALTSGEVPDLAEEPDSGVPPQFAQSPDPGEAQREPVDLQPPPRAPIDLDPGPDPVGGSEEQVELDNEAIAQPAVPDPSAGGPADWSWDGGAEAAEQLPRSAADGGGAITGGETAVGTEVAGGAEVAADAGSDDALPDVAADIGVIQEVPAGQQFLAGPEAPAGREPGATPECTGSGDDASESAEPLEPVAPTADADLPPRGEGIAQPGTDPLGAAQESAQVARPPRGEHAKDEDPGAGAPSLTERVLGCLLAGAVGDSLGGDPDQLGDPPHELRGTISDGTQLTLFTAEGLVRGSVTDRAFGGDDPLPEVQLAYQRWLHTQGVEWSVAAGRFAEEHRVPDGWLIEVPGLFASRDPGATVFDALLSFGSGGPAGSLAEPINDSKGCGGVVRAAPAALWSADPAEVFRLAARTAALTHSHPAGYHSAGALAVIVQQALLGRGLDDGVWLALQVLETWEGSEQTAALLKAAVELAEEGVPDPRRLTGELGGEGTAEQALAIAVCAALVAGEDVQLALRIAARHDGNTAATGAICGNIAGALHGVAALPVDWLAGLELRDVVQQMALDCVAEFGGAAFQSGAAIEPPTDEDWQERYPVLRLQCDAPEDRSAVPAVAGPAETSTDDGPADGGPAAGAPAAEAAPAGQDEDDLGAFPAPKPAPRRVIYEGDNA